MHEANHAQSDLARVPPEAVETRLLSRHPFVNMRQTNERHL